MFVTELAGLNYSMLLSEFLLPHWLLPLQKWNLTLHGFLLLETNRAPRLWMLQTEDNISFFGLTDLFWTCPGTRRNVAEEWILWPLQDQFLACVGPCTINYHPSAMFLLLFFFSIIPNQRWQISVCAYHNTWFFVLSDWRTLKDLSLRTIMMKFKVLRIDGFIRCCYMVHGL